MAAQTKPPAVASARGREDTYQNEPANYTPQTCPRFERCTAAVCPLDPDWRLRSHLNGERICHFVLELSKPGAEAVLAGVLPRHVAEAIAEATPGIIVRCGASQGVVGRVSGPRAATASRLAGGRRG